uniref:Reverse transcriptase N-terminal domain-containing protein n=1 Tax=Pyropia fucicola TaxID=144551 RepID=A0A060DD84_9RHOD|nr:hypothetical protein GU21_p31 [Neopyropia fucicola]AIB08102.1 hypothetical protein [Neopyropia fucicola]
MSDMKTVFYPKTIHRAWKCEIFSSEKSDSRQFGEADRRSRWHFFINSRRKNGFRKKKIDQHSDKILRVTIPKPNGSVKNLGIPTIRDRAKQCLVKFALELQH